MRKRKRGLTINAMQTALNAALPFSYHAFAFLLPVGGGIRWSPCVSVIIDGAAVSALDARETYATRGQALAAAYNAAKVAALMREAGGWELFGEPTFVEWSKS